MVRLKNIRIITAISISIIASTCLCTTADAQTVPEQNTETAVATTTVSPKSRWISYLSAGESIYVNYPDAIGMGSIMFSTGVQIADRHFIGLETGYTRRQAHNEERYTMMIPIGLTYKCKFTDRKISPFAGISALFLTFPGSWSKTGLVRPAIGVNFKTKKKLEFQVSAIYDFSVDVFTEGHGDTVLMHAVGLNLGISFWSDTKGDTFKDDYYKPRKASFRTF